jgi:Carboxypeptidase regulatory-like domain
MVKFKLFGLLFLLLISTTPFAIGQAVFGNIDGTVFDASGAAIPGANITITDQDRGSVFHVQSNEQGNYSQSRLLAGIGI